MGDRGNIKFIEELGSPSIFFYTHWSGYRLNEIIREGLIQGKGRWSDPPYLARIMFNALQGDDRGETGFGISHAIGDNEHPVMVVDADQQKVYIDGHATDDDPKYVMSFTDFVDSPRGLVAFDPAHDAEEINS